MMSVVRSHSPCRSAILDQQSKWFASRIDLARGGHDSAVAQLLESCRKYLLLAANRGLPPEVRGKIGGSDLVQETIIQAQSMFDRFEGHSQRELLAWTGVILDHKLAHARRRFVGTQKRDARLELPLCGGDPWNDDDLRLVDPIDSPSTIAIAGEEARLLKQAMARLPAEYRDMLVLRNWERLSFVEIAAIIERSPQAARKLWSRAVLALRKELACCKE